MVDLFSSLVLVPAFIRSFPGDYQVLRSREPPPVCPFARARLKHQAGQGFPLAPPSALCSTRLQALRPLLNSR